jgi:hypothetical protein
MRGSYCGILAYDTRQLSIIAQKTTAIIHIFGQSPLLNDMGGDYISNDRKYKEKYDLEVM